jgi:hypothetical protein
MRPRDCHLRSQNYQQQHHYLALPCCLGEHSWGCSACSALTLPALRHCMADCNQLLLQLLYHYCSCSSCCWCKKQHRLLWQLPSLTVGAAHGCCWPLQLCGLAARVVLRRQLLQILHEAGGMLVLSCAALPAQGQTQVVLVPVAATGAAAVAWGQLSSSFAGGCCLAGCWLT